MVNERLKFYQARLQYSRTSRYTNDRQTETKAQYEGTMD